ncbi:MAG TPA: UPF0175 family protein [Thermoanaerobaculia bacterium]
MDVTISLPEDISESLEGQWGNVSRHALETIAVERFEVHALLKEHKVPLHYTEADLEEDLAAHRDLGILSGR